MGPGSGPPGRPRPRGRATTALKNPALPQIHQFPCAKSHGIFLAVPGGAGSGYEQRRKIPSHDVHHLRKVEDDAGRNQSGQAPA